QVYRLCTVDGRSTTEAARELGIARSTAIDRLRRALEEVRMTRELPGLSPSAESLLALYVTGAANFIERRRAERLMRADPVAVVAARGLERYNAGVGALIPPAIIDRSVHPSLVDRVAGALHSARAP